jgi:crotonobetainyl-CoA:carnitine CoA-transferase CaiB-like acyl-CoA transferase
MARLGLGFGSLIKENPKLVYCSISGYGQNDKRGGYDLIVQAESGNMYSSGTEKTGIAKTAFPVADVLTGLFAGNSVLAGLFARERDRKGRYVEVSLMESMLSAMTNLATPCLATGEDPPRVGAAQPAIMPYQVFPCKDGHVAVGAPNNHLFECLCDVLGHPEWPADPRFIDNPSRNIHREELAALIEGALANATPREWIARFTAREVPCGPVQTIHEMMCEPELAARGTVVELDGVTHARTIANPMRFSDFQYTYRHPPKLGEHTDAVLRELSELPLPPEPVLKDLAGNQVEPV